MSQKYYSAYSQSEINFKRSYIRDTMVSQYGLEKNFTKISSKDIENLVKLYDEVFFDNQISKKLKEINSSLDYNVVSGKKATYAGECIRSKNGSFSCNYRIAIPLGVYSKLFNNKESKLYANGLECKNRLECLQLVIEHELIHLLMFIYNYYQKIQSGPGKKTYSAHGRLFKCMTYAYFGHTEVRHALLSDADDSSDLKKEDFKLGMRVYFINRHKQKIYGIVIKIMLKNISIKELLPVPGRKWKVDPSFLKIDV